MVSWSQVKLVEEQKGDARELEKFLTFFPFWSLPLAIDEVKVAYGDVV